MIVRNKPVLNEPAATGNGELALIIIRWCFAVSYIVLIFLFAKCPQSSAYNMAEQLFSWFPFLAETDIPVFVFYMRKSLHVLGYLIGTCIIFYAVKVTPVLKKSVHISTLGLALLLAVLDEWYQTTLPHRSGRIEDVFIDLIGIIIGLLLLRDNRKASGLN